MARIKSGVPTVKEIKEGESEYRYISGTGLVLYTRYSNQLYSTKMHAAPTPPVMDKKLEMAIGDRIGAATEEGEFIRSDGTVQFTGNQSHGGHDITGVNDLTVTDDVTIGDTLDVDGATTLDATEINTTDGRFAVSGANNIDLVTTGSADINLTSADKLEFAITGDSNWDTTTVDWDSSGDVVLTSLGDVTIESQGADAAGTKTLSLIGGKSDYSKFGLVRIKNYNVRAADFTGIHLYTSSNNIGSSHNDILIECDNVSAKGSTYGVDIRSENNIRLRSENNNSAQATSLLMRATGPIDIGVSASLTPHTSDDRVKIHGLCQISQLFNGGSDTIDCSTHSVNWDQIDTAKLMRAMTYKANSSALAQSSELTIVTAANDDNALSTVWMVTVYWKHSSTKRNLQVYWVFFTSSSSGDIVKVVEELDPTGSAASTAGVLSWTSGGGIVWTNGDSQDARVHASALRIQSSADF